MPSTIAQLLKAAGLQSQGFVPWGTSPDERGPGIYLVATTKVATSLPEVYTSAPISLAALEFLLNERPELRLDDERPTAEELGHRIERLWLPDEVILYIGLAGTSVRKRVEQYYRTPLGARRPHAGGWPLKLLSNLDDLYVHYASTEDAARAEFTMLKIFVDAVSAETRATLHDPDHPFPFANLEWPPGTRKRHGITGATGDASRAKDEGNEAGALSESSSERGTRMDVAAINAHIQRKLRLTGQTSVTAVEAARWLDEVGLLKDSLHRPGLPLRKLLRDGQIDGQRQEANSRWFIDLVTN
jgi:hypothetical protein